jgi:undecaprenyl phosphate-alpha-L-ara4N flippase subunit ArnE
MVVQTALLVTSQVTLKIAMTKMNAFSWTKDWFLTAAKNIPLAISGITIVGASILWLHVLKKYEFSLAYPLVAISYVFGMVAAILVFKETVPVLRWIGVSFIIIGVILVAKSA